MKHIALIFSALLLCACYTEERECADEFVDVNVRVDYSDIIMSSLAIDALSDDESSTRSDGVSLPGFGDGTTAHYLTYAVYSYWNSTAGDLVDYGVAAYEFDDNLSVDISFKLLKNSNYYFAFWADSRGTSELSDDDIFVFDFENATVSLDYASVEAQDTIRLAANNEERDAFWSPLIITNVSAGDTYDCELTRVMTQINIGSTETDEWFDEAMYHTTLPADEIYTQFNLITGEVSAPSAMPIKFSGARPAEEQFPIYYRSYRYISMNYVLAPVEKQIVNGYLTVRADHQDINDDGTAIAQFNTIPLRRNYRTNIYGALFSDEEIINGYPIEETDDDDNADDDDADSDDDADDADDDADDADSDDDNTENED